MAYVWPVEGPITQGYSLEHPAIDIACIPGNPVVAMHGGQLTTRWSPRMGNTAVVTHVSGLWTSYSHLGRAFPAKEVKAGETIGECGDTGSWSSGPHVHVEASSRGPLWFLSR